MAENSRHAFEATDESIERFQPSPVDLGRLVRDFVAMHASRGGQQRSAEWYRTMETTIGGSEMAALMGMNPYSSFRDVISSKLGIKKWDGGSIACWWGSMFEDVVARVVEIDCDTTVLGDEICIQKIPGSRYSPDGYCVLRGYTDSDGEARIWTPVCGSEPEFEFIVLLEIKSPFRRMPDGKVVRYYRPQIWTGAVNSPIVHTGMFVDAAFRKCSIADLGPEPSYDTHYHNDRSPPTNDPFAWGMVAVFAPRLDAPREVRIGDPVGDSGERGSGERGSGERGSGGRGSIGGAADASMDAWKIASKYLGTSVETNGESVVDFGDCDGKLFDTMMGLVNAKRFLTQLLDPCLEDGRGADLRTGATIGSAIDVLRANPPMHHFLLGVIPWKLFEINYVPEPRLPGFTSEVKAVVDKAQTVIAAARSSGDPEVFLQNLMAERAGPPRASRRVDDSSVQELFDLIL
jgi:hypothetical protein